MKRLLLLFVGAVAAVGLLQASPALASNDAPTTIDASVYRVGQQITISENVKGDVFCAGQSVEITGTIEGDVICAGQTVRVSGIVKGDTRVAGQTVTIAGHVQGSASVVAASFALEKSGLVDRDLSVNAQSTQLLGQVLRDANLAGNVASIDGLVGRNVHSYVQNVALRDNAKIGGAFTYTSNNQAKVSAAASVAGQTEHKIPPAEPKRPSSIVRIVSPLYMLAVLFITIALALIVTPRWFTTTSERFRQRKGASIGVGAASLVLMPIAAVVLLITVVGIPLGLGLFAFWLLAMSLGLAVSAYSLGEWLVRLAGNPLPKYNQILAVASGVCMLLLLLSLPIIGFFVGLIAVLWGLGAVVLSVIAAIRAQQQSPKK